MGILSYGTVTSDVEVMLGLSKPVDILSPAGLRVVALVNAVEADVRAITGRAFEQATYTDYALDGPGYPSSILTLPDKPVTTWTSAKQVGTRDATTGAPVTADLYSFLRNEYVVDMAAGTVRLLSGYWPSGPQALIFSGVLGYTPTQITNNSADEIRILKALLSSILARERSRFELGIHHVTAMSLGDESVSSFRTQLTQWEENQIRTLKMRVF